MNANHPDITACLAKLRSPDPTVRNEGVDAALALGVAVIPALLPLLEADDDAVRAAAVYILAQLATPEVAEPLLRATNDPGAAARAYAAVGLARLQHPAALSACVQALNDAPDPLHLDITPAAQALGEMGLVAVPAVLDLMLSEEPLTRLRAQRALELILSHRHGFQPARGFPTPAAEERMRAEWQSNGNYDADQSPQERAAAVAKWRQWLAARTAVGG